MSTPITYADLAELHEAIGSRGAAHFRLAAEIERNEPLDALGGLDDALGGLDAVRNLLWQVPETKKSVKHTDDYWRQHASCLADRVLELIGDE